MASEWLRIMLDEIARKQDDARRANDEARLREAERTPTPSMLESHETAVGNDKVRLR